MRRNLVRILAVTVVGALAPLTLARADAGTTYHPRAAKVRVVTYPGFGVTIHRASHQLHRLHDTSPAFRHSVSKALNKLWRENGSDPDCATAAVVVVKRWRSDGWAYIDDIGNFEPCATGGNWEIWRARHGSYKSVLGGQDDPTCRALRRRDVPANIWTHKCFNGHGKLVHYSGP